MTRSYEINNPEQCRTQEVAAVRGLTDESGREVLTASGIFIAKLAEAQR
jgi:hypothetical protein